MGLLSLLWHLQTIDSELDDKTTRARQVDDALANDPNLVAARSAHDAAQKRLATLRAQWHDRELEAKTLDAKIKGLEERLYSGRVTNPKELDGMGKDLEMHKRLRSALDDKLLELMEAIEQAQHHATEQARALAQTEAARARTVEDLTREREAVTARIAELNAAREAARATLDPAALKVYDHLRQTKAGHAVVLVKRDACSACGVTVPTGWIQRVREGNEMVLCSGCGRILAI